MKRFLLAAAAIFAAGADPAAAASHARMIEAYAEAPFDKTTPLRISPITIQQAKDPTYRDLAMKLADVLIAQGFTLARASDKTDHIVTLEYKTHNTNLRASGETSVDDPSYRMAIVTAWNIKDPSDPKLVWQTAVDSYGISMDAKSVIPPLIDASGKYLAVSKTNRGVALAAWCADGVPLLGSHISPECTSDTERPAQNLAGQLLGAGTVVPVPGAG